MRFKSATVGGFKVFAVSGINTVSFGIEASTAARKDLLGFGVERQDLDEGERYPMYGFKVFESIIPSPNKDTQVSTFDHPVQSFVWDDFTAKEGHRYKYWFHPLKGTPKNLDRSAKPVPSRRPRMRCGARRWRQELQRCVPASPRPTSPGPRTTCSAATGSATT